MSLPLILGGHSFIQQLGNDPLAKEEEQCAIVTACLDAGITTFDTTYRPERLALGRALAALGRRTEAQIIAWNFFQDFIPGGEVGGPEAYCSEHIDSMLADLRTTFIDHLVVHPVTDPAENRRQESLAVEWQQNGLVGRLGTWWPGADVETAFGGRTPYSFMVRPWNLATPDAAPVFTACKRLGWENLACSPFVRGWELDRLVQTQIIRAGGEETDVRSRLADAMLRFSLFQPGVDRLIVAVRRVAWVQANVESIQRGPLSPAETAWLGELWSEL